MQFIALYRIFSCQAASINTYSTNIGKQRSFPHISYYIYFKGIYQTLKTFNKNIIISILLGLIFFHAKANYDSLQNKFQFPYSLSVGITSKGVGIESVLWKNQSKTIDIRLNSFYIGYKKKNLLEMDKGTSVEILPNIENLSFGCLIDYFPFRNKLFRLSGGLESQIIQNYQATFSSNTGLNLGGLQISSEDFGVVSFGIKWNTIRPYIGLGFGRANSSRRLSLCSDIGTYFMGSPNLNINYEGFLETTTIDDSIKKIETNMSGYKFYPHISIILRYNFEPTKSKN